MTNKEITNAYYGSDQVEKIYLGSDVIWPAQEPGPEPAHDYSKDYLTIEVVGDPGYEGALTIRNNLVQYSLNGGPWTNNTILDYLHPGDIIRFRGNENSATGQGNFSGNTLQFKVYGNIESLEYGDNFSGQTATRFSGSFQNCFRGCTGLTDASNLVLPATALTSSCYYNMFYGCTSLTTAPELPATTLANTCYNGMFNRCASLTKAPELPATTLVMGCYSGMFNSCTSLTTAPVLPATTLYSGCYQNMFSGCTNLERAEIHSTTVGSSQATNMFSNCTALKEIICLFENPNSSYTRNWVTNVASSGTFYKSPNASAWPTGTSGIPSGWRVENYIEDCWNNWQKEGYMDYEDCTCMKYGDCP
jgi:hypothetical protein